MASAGGLTTEKAAVMLAILAASYAATTMDRQALFLLLPAIGKALRLPLTQLGALSTAFSLGMAATGLPAGLILDRFGRRAVIVLGAAASALGTLLTALSLGFGDMVRYRVLSGLGQGLENAGVYAAVGSFYATLGRRTTALAAVSMGYAAGSVVGPALGAFLGARLGWRFAFAALGLVGLALTGLVLLCVAPELTEAKANMGGRPGAVSRADLWNGNLIIGIVVTLFVGVAEYGYLGLYPTFLMERRHFAPMTAAWCFSLFGVGGLAALPAGWVGDRLRLKPAMIGALLAAALCGYLAFHALALPWQQAALTFFQGIVASGFLYNAAYALLQRSVSSPFVGRASGIFVTAFYLASGAAGYLFASLVAAVGWGMAATIQLVLVPLAAVGATLLMRDERLMPA